MIRKKGSTYVVESESGKKLGTYRSRKDAAERLRQVEAAKAAKSKGKKR